MNIPLSEQETTINILRDSEKVDIWTNDSTMMTKLDKMCKTSPENYQCKRIDHFSDGTIADKEYTIADKGLVSFRPARMKKELTQEQRAIAAERARRTLHQKT